MTSEDEGWALVARRSAGRLGCFAVDVRRRVVDGETCVMVVSEGWRMLWTIRLCDAGFFFSFVMREWVVGVRVRLKNLVEGYVEGTAWSLLPHVCEHVNNRAAACVTSLLVLAISRVTGHFSGSPPSRT